MVISPISPLAVTPPTLRPRINLNTISPRNRRPLPDFPVNFTNTDRSPLNSKHWGNTPFFTNAKAASMLEKGWLRSMLPLQIGEKGLYTMKDGPNIEVTVDDVILRPQKRARYIFIDSSGQEIEAVERDRFEEWDFYTSTTPVPFVPVKKTGGTKKRKTYKKRSKKQK